MTRSTKRATGTRGRAATRATTSSAPKAKAPTGHNPTPKSEATRARIITAALGLFRQRGYERTTMAAIAKRAGVSKGNAYYYFASKEELIQGFYDELQADFAAAVDVRALAPLAFDVRVRATLFAWLDVATPHHAYADKLFRSAANPESPLSPFSRASARARAASMKVYAGLVAELPLDDPTRAALAKALWLLHMGLVLFWVFDRSPQQFQSRAVAARAANLVAGAVEMMQLPFLESMRGDIVAMIEDVVRGLLPPGET